MIGRICKMVDTEANKGRETRLEMYCHKIQDLNHQWCEVSPVPLEGINHGGEEVVHEAKRRIKGSGRKTIFRFPVNGYPTQKLRNMNLIELRESWIKATDPIIDTWNINNFRDVRRMKCSRLALVWYVKGECVKVNTSNRSIHRFYKG